MIIEPVMMGETQQLFGVCEIPNNSVGDIGIIILSAGVLHSAGPFRLHVSLSNRLARLGFPVLRVDQSGKGESPRRPGMDRSSTILRDYDEAFDEFAAKGVQRTVLVGLCWGADDAVYIASQRDSVIGVVTFDGFAYPNQSFYARHYLKKSLSLTAWWSFLKRMVNQKAEKVGADNQTDSANNLFLRDWPERSEMIHRYTTLLDKGIKLLSIYTQGQNYYNHVGQLASNLPGSDKSCLREVLFGDADHTFSLTAHRERLIELVEEWIEMEIRSDEKMR